MGEVFIDGPKAGSDAEINATDASVILSIALQHRAKPEDMRSGISRNAVGEPLGPIGALLDKLAAGEGA